SFTPLPQRMPDPSGGGGPLVLSVSEFDEDMHVTGALTDAQPMVEIIERLAELGNRRFLHITGPLDFPAAVARRDAYLETVQRLGLESIGVAEGDWTSETGMAIVASLPDDAVPLAVIAPNDNV